MREIRKAIEPERVLMCVVRVVIGIREVRNDNLKKPVWSQDSRNFIHQQPYVANVLKEVMRIDGENGFVLDLVQDLIDIPHNVDAVIVDRVDPDSLTQPLTIAAAQFELHSHQGR